MKQIQLIGLAKDRTEEGYQFFVEALDEMLFDYTLDTYKPSTHNASTLVYEILETIDDIEGGLVDKGHFSHLIDELRWMLTVDTVAKKLLEISPDAILSDCTRIIWLRQSRNYLSSKQPYPAAVIFTRAWRILNHSSL